MHHTMRFPRTLAGFGLTWHRGSRFSCFLEILKLTSSPNTSKLDLGPPDWSSIFFESQGTISGVIKPIIFPTNDLKKNRFFGNLDNLPKSVFFDKMASSYFSFFWAHLEPGPNTAPHSQSAYALGLGDQEAAGRWGVQIRTQPILHI